MNTSPKQINEQESSKFCIRLLGEFRLADESGSVAEINQHRLQSMLAYLILHCRSAQPRSRLAYLFWPESSEGQARTNLRNLLFLLRRGLPKSKEYVQITAKTVQWHCDAPCMVDVIEFETAVAQANLAEERGDHPDMLRWLERAVNLYGGELLPGFYDDWVLLERERLGRLFAQALAKLAHLNEEARDYGHAIAHAERLLRHDPLCETTHRLLMRLYVMAGDRAGSLRVYHKCAAMLMQELGATPSAETEQSYHRLFTEETSTGEQTGGTQYISSAGSSNCSDTEPAMVGRLSEWQTLTSAWNEAQDGHRQVAFITGEAGIGKTRLAEEVVDSVTRQGFAVASARAARESVPFAPVTQWLRSRSITAVLDLVEDIWLTEITRLLPELARKRPDLPTPESLSEGWQRQRLYEALAQIILAAGEPILLYIDNVHWCDPETLSWLSYLLRFGTRGSFMMLGTLCTEEVDNEHTVTAWRVSMQLDSRQVDNHSVRYREIELDRFGIDETAKLAAFESGQVLAPDESRRFHDETEGHPLFIVEMARNRQLKAKPGEPYIEQMFNPWQPIALQLPSRVLALLESRIQQLSSSTKELAAVAAVLGREFTYSALAAITELDEEQLVSSLEELWRRRIIYEYGVESYIFSHDKLRRYIYARLSRGRRQLIYRHAADVLKQSHVNAPDCNSERIAGHIQNVGSIPERSWAGSLVRDSTRALASVGALESRREHLPFSLPRIPGSSSTRI